MNTGLVCARLMDQSVGSMVFLLDGNSKLVRTWSKTGIISVQGICLDRQQS